ncbi:MAG: hypothetical protein ACYS8L_01755 [Planctomycetota bacterium]|jgi:hypothetical protein
MSTLAKITANAAMPTSANALFMGSEDQFGNTATVATPGLMLRMTV